MLPVLFFRNRGGLMCSCLLTAVLLAMRCDLGDYARYYETWKIIRLTDWDELTDDHSIFYFLLRQSDLHSEYGFLFLQKFFPYNFLWLIALISFIQMAAFYLLISEYVDEKYYPLAMLLALDPIILLVNASAIRQVLALAFLIFSVHLLLREKFIASLLLILAGSFFHKSVIVLIILFVPYLLLKKGKYRLLIAAIIASTVVLAFSAGALVTQFDFYSEYIEYNMSSSRLIMSVLLLIPIILSLQDISKGDIKIRFITMIYSLIICCRVLCLLPNLSMLNRYTLYFDAFSVVALPMVIKRKPNWRTLICIFCVSYVAARSIVFFINPLFIGETTIDFTRQNIFVSGQYFIADY